MLNIGPALRINARHIRAARRYFGGRYHTIMLEKFLPFRFISMISILPQDAMIYIFQEMLYMPMIVKCR